MRNLIAAVYFLLSLFGCETGSTITVTRSVMDGVEAIHSRSRTMAGIARFECIASASGECHYTLFPRQCASAEANCTRPIERFVMSTGQTREVVGLPTFKACVTGEEAALTPDCAPSTSMRNNPVASSRRSTVHCVNRAAKRHGARCARR